MVMVFSLISLISCSDDNAVEKQNQLENRIEEIRPNSVAYKNALYFLDEDLIVNEFVDNRLESYFLISDENIDTEYVNQELNNDFIIRNTSTNENILVTNIQEYERHFTFDIVANNQYIEGFTYNLENSNTTNANPAVVRAVVAIVVAVIASIEDSPLEQCRGAMQALNCSGGTNPYMQFSEGWFSTTCNVGCR